MQIQKLNASHIDALQKIYNQQFGAESWTKEQILSAFLNQAVSFYGIFNEEKLVCFASIMTSLDDINLLDIATLEEYKNKGYAKAMLKYLISLKELGQTFSLEVKSKNYIAINLYTSFGFKTLHIRKNYYKDGDDALCMFLQSE